MYKYPYTILPSEFGSVYKPLIPVYLNYKTTHKITPPILALIDSGADVCFCSKNIGIWLGINFARRRISRKFVTANNTTFTAYQEEINLYFGKEKINNCPFFFADSLPKETPLILGQLGFFDHYRISFDIKNKEIEIC